MDGNNRYGKKHSLPAGQGHSLGSDRLEPVLTWCRDHAIEVLSVFAFSSENWQRSAQEVNFLMDLFKTSMIQRLPDMIKNGIKVIFTGDRTRLSESVMRVVDQVESDTASGKRLILNVAFSYGGRWDITQAARKLCEQVSSGKLEIEAIDEGHFESALSTAGLPAVDLLIRTGGEFRISNFLLWQAAYAELYFTDRLWPDFGHEDLDQALNFFNQRVRRYGR
jgi:undecaprenyl diphosphate synthase